MDDLRRELRGAIYAFVFIIPIGVIGFSTIENYTFIEALYATIITLTTIGYGDYSPSSTTGQVFTIFLVIIGIGAVVNVGSTSIAFLSHPIIRQARQNRRTRRKVEQLSKHFIICGMGEMVDKTVEHLLHFANASRAQSQQRYAAMVDKALNPFFNHTKSQRIQHVHQFLRSAALTIITTLSRQRTILDVVVVVTHDADYAQKLREQGLIAIIGDPTNDTVLVEAGVQRAQALMVILGNDTETLLTVLTAHTIAPTLHITAAVLDDELSHKVTRVGANSVITPFDTAGQFLNSMTFRPVVSDFFISLLFDPNAPHQLLQLTVLEDSMWEGRTIGELELDKHYGVDVIGIRYADAHYGYAPSADHRLQEDETLVVVSPNDHVETLLQICHGDFRFARTPLFQPLPMRNEPLASDHSYSLIEAEEAARSLKKHFIICGDDRVIRSAISRLNPERPFVIVSNDNTLTSNLLKRGFRVIHGRPTNEEILQKAGVKRAQAIMVSLEEKADSILTILNARTLNRRLLITATASSDDMVDKLDRAGADRIINPFHVAAEFILLSTIRPELAQFVHAIQFNYHTQLETTEIYMEDNSVWIGETIAELGLMETYQAGVIGIREANKQTFIYAPPSNHLVQKGEVLIIVTPMQHADDLLHHAHGGTARKPETLRTQMMQSQKWTPEQIKAMLRQAQND